MRFLIDTNILLHAVNAGSPAHGPAHQFVQEHLRLRNPWCITWPILYEFLRVSTHSRVFPKPLKPGQALDFIASLTSREEVAVLTETDRHMAVLEGIVGGLGHPGGNLFHDTHRGIDARTRRGGTRLRRYRLFAVQLSESDKPLAQERLTITRKLL